MASVGRPAWKFFLDNSSIRSSTTAANSLPVPPGYAFEEQRAKAACNNAAVSSNSSSISHRSSHQSQRFSHPVAAGGSAVNSSGVATAAAQQQQRQTAALLKKGWEIALAPAKQLAMNFFMIYMGAVSASGIFGILILVYVLHSCLSSALNLQSAFAGIDAERLALGSGISGGHNNGNTSGALGGGGSRLSLQQQQQLQASKKILTVTFLFQKLVYLTVSIGGCVYVLQHCARAGLLPLSSGDFIALIPEKEVFVLAIDSLI